MAVVANQAVAFDKSILMACPHRGDVLRPGLILDHGKPEVISSLVGLVPTNACVYWSGRRPGGNPEVIAKPPAKENNPVQAHFILARLL
jgi:hypothetical protein